MFQVEKAPDALIRVSAGGRPRSPLSVAIGDLPPGHMIRVPADKFSIDHVRNLVTHIRLTTGKKCSVRKLGDEVVVVAIT